MPESDNQPNIEASTNLNALLLQSMAEGMILQDSEGKILQFNQAAVLILGTTVDDLQAQDNLYTHIPDKIFPGKNHVGMKSLQTGVTQRNIILNIFRLDGEMRWISLNSVPIFNSNKNKANQLLNTFTDITETKKNLNDLKQVQLLFNISHDLTIITNKEGYFKKINPRFNETLGHTFLEIVSLKFIDFVHPEDVDPTMIQMKKSLETKESVHFINRYQAKNGDYRVFDWIVVPDKETNLVYFTARDITDYRAEELDLIHSSKVYSIGELTSGIAYAIHGELAVMAGHISNIQDHLDKDVVEPEEVKKKILHVEESIKRLTKTTKGLTLFARNTENEPFLDTALSKILDNAIGLCKERFRVHGVKLDIQLSEDTIIRCRETQLTQVFITLLNSAYDEVHTMRDSWVQLVAHAHDDVIEIFISNSAKKSKEIDPKLFLVPQGIIEENFGKFSFDESDFRTRFILEFPIMKKASELNLN